MLWGLEREEYERVAWGILLMRFLRGWDQHPMPARRYARECASVGVEFNAEPPEMPPKDTRKAIKRRNRINAAKVRRGSWRLVGGVLGALLAFNM